MISGHALPTWVDIPHLKRLNVLPCCLLLGAPLDNIAMKKKQKQLG